MEALVLKPRNRSILKFLVLIIALLPIPAVKAKPNNPGPFFSIAILAPNTSSSYSPWPTILLEQLPKIGINVSTFDFTGWSQISPRTWSYPGPYPIPTYDEGGYDVLMIFWTFGLDYNPLGLLNSDAITPNGDNFYQYSSFEMDNIIYNYTEAFTFDDRFDLAEDMQLVLYEEQPSIALMYDKEMYVHDEDLTGWKSLLWHLAQEPMIEWQIPGKNELHYATPEILFYFHPMICDDFDFKWLHQIYNGLTERDSNSRNTFGPWLAQLITSSDGITYDVQIKKEACWADGTNLTTDDIIYNYWLAYELYQLSHYDSTINWDSSPITKINDKEFTIEFNEPSLLQPNYLGLDLVPKHIWNSTAPADHNSQAEYWCEHEPEKIFGTGPYILSSCDFTNGVVHLTRNTHFSDWYDDESFFEDIYFEQYPYYEPALEALEFGAVDIVDAEFGLNYYFEHDIPDTIATLVDDTRYYEIAINQEHPYLGTGELCPIAGKESAKHIRKAISHIIPRQSTINDYYDGYGTPGVTQFPKVGIGFLNDLLYYRYDLNQAYYHMAMAGFDVPYNPNDPYGGRILLVGLNLPVILCILALIGGSLIILRKKTGAT